MEDNKIIKNIMKKAQMKIAVSKFDEEDINMPKMKNIPKIVATIIMTIGLTGGMVFAANMIYEKVWKEPERVQLTGKLMEEEKIAQENIPEEEAKKIAEEKLINLGFGKEEIIGTNHYTDEITGEIRYRFSTNNKWSITIKGFTGEFFDISSEKMYNKSLEKYEINKQEAIEIANNYYKSFGHKEGEYELKEMRAQNNFKNNNEKGYKWEAIYYRKYGEIYNRYECIWIGFYAKDGQLNSYRFENEKCDNNPVEITKEQAIDIAKQEDRKVETCDIIEVKAGLQIQKMNGNAYARLNNTEEYYKPMTATDVPIEETVQYKTENKIRKVWVVVLNYGEGKVENKGENLTEEEERENLMNRYVKGQYSYFVDVTTGEIIGGGTSDYLLYDLWGQINV